MNAPVSPQSLGMAKAVFISDLLLDAENPRLAASHHGKSQEDLAVILEMGFDAFAVAESMARHGFFPSEPLIVIHAEQAGKYTVIEGNRRLTALLGLTRPDIRKEFASPERWEQLASKSAVRGDASVPVVVATSRQACTPVVGFRHISGILQWSPYAQAMYVASLVDGAGLTFDQVHQEIGIDKRDVANLYREQAIAKQAQRLGIPTGNLEASFSLLQVAMGSTKLRDFVGAPLGSRLQPQKDPIPDDKVAELEELLGYVFGNGAQEPVITDSRQIPLLGNVIAEPTGLAALRAGETLLAAKQKIDDSEVDPKDRLSRRLTTAKNALGAASADMPQFYADADILELLEEVSAALRELEPPTS
jgi:hypothetical protein